MDKKVILDTIKYAKENSPKRNFKQAVDIIINFSDLDLKKPDNQIDTYIQLPHSRNRKIRVCALVDTELHDEAKRVCDNTITLTEFDKYINNKKLIKKLAMEYDFFIAQSTIMPKVAMAFGKILGPRNKMPNPKAGCVVPPNANLSQLYEKLQHTIRVSVKTHPFYQSFVGYEDMNDEELAENILTIYKSVLTSLPKEHYNIKRVYLKLTMGKAVKLSQTTEEKTKETKKSRH